MPSNNFIETIFTEYGWLGAVGLLMIFFSWVQIREKNNQAAFQDKVNTAYFEERKDNMLRAEKYQREQHEQQTKIMELTELVHSLRNELELALRRLDDCEEKVKEQTDAK